MATALARAAAAMLLAATLALPAHAGRSCPQARPTTATIERGLRLAQRTHEALEAAHASGGVKVVLLARAGPDLRRDGVRYSHRGIAYRVADAGGQPAWRVLHKHNACGTADAAIYRQGLGEFFLDDLWRFEAAWAVPTPEVQAKLAAPLADGTQALRMHKPYSIVSYAWGRRYQQSNQWAIETLAQAMDPGVTSRDRAQAWLQLRGDPPAALHLGAADPAGRSHACGQRCFRRSSGQ